MNRLKIMSIAATVIMLMAMHLFGNEWATLLELHKHHMDVQTYAILVQQHAEFVKGSAPAIADPRIKAIEIIECNEPIVDLYRTNHPRIHVMEGECLHQAHSCPEDIDPRSEGHSCMRKGVFDALVRMVTILDELAPSFGYEAGELEIHLFEGLRDLATQKTLFDTLFNNIKQENPHMSDDEAYAQTSKFVSPYINNTPVHSTGAAIDIHLWSKKQQNYCHMGRFNSSKDGAPTFSEEISQQQKLHRLLFLVAATQSGLTNYVYEFWHFSYDDRYACYWRGEHHARYGSA